MDDQDTGNWLQMSILQKPKVQRCMEGFCRMR